MTALESGSQEFDLLFASRTSQMAVIFKHFIPVVSQINVCFTTTQSYTTNSIMWQPVSACSSRHHQAYQFVRTANINLTHNIRISSGSALIDIFMTIFIKGLVSCNVFICCSHKLRVVMMARRKSRN